MRPSRSPSTGFTPSGPSSTSLSSWAALQRRGGHPKTAQEAVRRRDSIPSSSIFNPSPVPILCLPGGQGAFEKELLGLTGGFPGGGALEVRGTGCCGASSAHSAEEVLLLLVHGGVVEWLGDLSHFAIPTLFSHGSCGIMEKGIERYPDRETEKC
ncbi:hypothetical protein J5N97_010029 [Dioscorea zingiberensis]|uniref:Uncharacterized protein n=1 Tax=Dioscorea zingiberensis TaxID=325984 RepID=A0A9D5CZG6_9LILI|nr:hypothetical protein J5N97_010029 [Dioscorea zingiberensis]